MVAPAAVPLLRRLRTAVSSVIIRERDRLQDCVDELERRLALAEVGRHLVGWVCNRCGATFTISSSQPICERATADLSAAATGSGWHVPRHNEHLCAVCAPVVLALGA